MSSGPAGLVMLAFTVFILGILDIDVFWPAFVAVSGGWATLEMTVILIAEGAGIVGELRAL